MSFKTIVLCIAIAVVVTEANFIKIETKNAVSTFSTSVKESNMPTSWQVEAAENLAELTAYYDTVAKQAAALSEIFSTSHPGYSWFVAVNASYIYNPLDTYYVDLTVSGTGAGDVRLFAGNAD